MLQSMGAMLKAPPPFGTLGSLGSSILTSIPCNEDMVMYHRSKGVRGWIWMPGKVVDVDPVALPRRSNPLEALVLIKTCDQAVRGRQISPPKRLHVTKWYGPYSSDAALEAVPAFVSPWRDWSAWQRGRRRRRRKEKEGKGQSENVERERHESSHLSV